MAFEKLVVAVHGWARRLSPARVRTAVKRQLESEEGVEAFHRGTSVDAVLVMVQMGLGPAMRPVAFRKVGGEAPGARKAESSIPQPAARSNRVTKKPDSSRSSRKLTYTTGQDSRGRPSKRAQALLREQLAHGPRPGEAVQAAAEAADIRERSLIAAASSLGVRTRKGQWWLPGGV